jgi:hypothetical protein
VFITSAPSRADVITLYTGNETTISLGPGTYDISAYGADGGYSTIIGNSGGLGAEMEAQFNFTLPTILTLLVGGIGADGLGSARGAGGDGTTLHGRCWWEALGHCLYFVGRTNHNPTRRIPGFAADARDFSLNERNMLFALHDALIFRYERLFFRIFS